MDEAFKQAEAAVNDLLARPAWAASEQDSVLVLRRAQTLITQLTALQAVHRRCSA